MDKKENQKMTGVCPNCGKPFKIESRNNGEDWCYCTDACLNPASVPTGVRLMPDKATLLFVDGNMKEYMREEYIKVHGIDPLPIWKAMDKWREEQMDKWKRDGVGVFEKASRGNYHFITPPPPPDPSGHGHIGCDEWFPRLYDGFYWSGNMKEIKSDKPDLGTGIAGSIDVPRKYVVTIYESTNYQGKARNFYYEGVFSEDFYGGSIKIRKISPLEEEDKSTTKIKDIISPADIDEILNAHNKYRMQIGVKPLLWDDQLAASAKEWANHLNIIGYLEHYGPGENLGWGYRTWTNTIDSMASEIKCFKNGIYPDIYNGQCNDCNTQDEHCAGHYSQIVWSKTEKIGCGKSGNFRVLRYSPAGNVYGEKAY